MHPRLQAALFCALWLSAAPAAGLGPLPEHPEIELLPALIVMRSDSSSKVRSWATAKIRALGMEDPEVATTLPDAHLVAEVVRAYVQPLDFAAMPTLVRLVDSDRLQVRDAARFAVARFGKNAIWQLRELYAEVEGRPADRAWDAERTAVELYAALDRDETDAANALFTSGQSALARGDLPAMQTHYDELLARFPRFAPQASLAPGYAMLGKALLDRDQLLIARNAYQRALRLHPTAPDAEQTRGQLAFIDAEIAQSQGVVDLHGYETALRHAPDLPRAADATDRLTGARAARLRNQKRLAAAGAIGLLLVVCALLLRRRPEPVANANAA